MMTGKFKRDIFAFGLLSLSGVTSAQVLTPQIPTSQPAPRTAPSAAAPAAPAAPARNTPSAPAASAAPKAAPPSSDVILSIDSLPGSPTSASEFEQELLNESRPVQAPVRPSGPLNFDPEPGTSRWARSSFGAYLGLGSATVLNTPFRISQDEVLVGSASEFGVGVGVLLDFALPGAQDNGYRLKVGMQRQSFTPDAATAAAYTTGQLETSGVMLDISLLYRFYLPYLGDLADLWFGAGGALDYALSTSRPNLDEVVPASRVRNSYGFRAIAAMGVEVPVSGIHDIVLEADWSLLKGWGLYMGFKTSL